MTAIPWYPLRLHPGDDLRQALERAAPQCGVNAAFVVAGIGSLSVARLRFAGAAQSQELRGDLEIVSMSGSLTPDGAHVHASVADATGRVFGGHVAPGCVVRTTAEVLLALLPQWSLTREMDTATGYAELVVRPVAMP